MSGYQPRYGYVLTVGPDPKGRGLLAILSDGSPQLGTPTEVLTLEIVKTRKEAKKWSRRMQVEQPWVARN